MPRPPSRGPVTEGYGWRTWTQPARMHFGEDTIGDGNYAPVSGTVLFAGYYGGLGNMVAILQNGTNVIWIIGHHEYLLAVTGQWINEGDRIGQIGTTGDSTGIHAHTERRVGGGVGDLQGGVATNPRDYYTSSAGMPGESIPIENEEEDEFMVQQINYDKQVLAVTEGATTYILIDTRSGFYSETVHLEVAQKWAAKHGDPEPTTYAEATRRKQAAADVRAGGKADPVKPWTSGMAGKFSD